MMMRQKGIHSSAGRAASWLVLSILAMRSNVAMAANWELLWSDEFDSPPDSPRSRLLPNNSTWTPRTGFLGLNGEFQTYTDSPANLKVENGHLHLTAMRDLGAQVGYTSARINTKDKLTIQYGMVEASIKIPDMKLGLWPAFWTLGQDMDQVDWPKAGEIDIMEIGQGYGSSIGLGNHRVLSALHWDAHGQYAQENGILDVPENLSDDFHTYKMEWTPQYIATYVDDRLIKKFLIFNCKTYWDCPEFHQPHYLILNLAISGQFTCCQYGFELNDFPNGTEWTMLVDYVRVYGNHHTKVTLPQAQPLLESAVTQSSVPTAAPSVAQTLPETIVGTEQVMFSPASTVAATMDPTALPTSLPSMAPTTTKPTISPTNSTTEQVVATTDELIVLATTTGNSESTINQSEAMIPSQDVGIILEEDAPMMTMAIPTVAPTNLRVPPTTTPSQSPTTMAPTALPTGTANEQLPIVADGTLVPTAAPTETLPNSNDPEETIKTTTLTPSMAATEELNVMDYTRTDVPTQVPPSSIAPTMMRVTTEPTTTPSIVVVELDTAVDAEVSFANSGGVTCWYWRVQIWSSVLCLFLPWLG